MGISRGGYRQIPIIFTTMKGSIKGIHPFHQTTRRCSGWTYLKRMAIVRS